MTTSFERKILNFLKKHQSGVLVLASVLLFVLIALSQIIPTHAALNSKERPKGGQFIDHVTTKVAVSFDGQKYNFFTRTDNLGQAFDQQGLLLDKRDRIEPGFKTKLTGEEISINVEKAKPVKVVDNDLSFETKVVGNTVGEILSNLKLKVHKEDIVMPPEDTTYMRGTEIVIERAKRVLVINGDKEKKVRTNAGNVLDVLRELGIKLEPGQLVKPELDKSIVDRMVIHIFGEGEDILIEKVPIAYKVIYRDDPNLSVGEQVIVQQGKDGEKEQTLKIVRKYGKITNYEVIKEKILRKSRPAIIRRGTKVAGTSLTGTATWYGPGFYGNHTANGEILDKTSRTAAHLTLPFGTRVKVINLQNGKSCTVRINDRGPFGCSHIIDLSVASKEAIGMVSVALVRLEVLK
ncbi:septal ring lytic transglycosylase RlpA family protein [Patescibacteria group bacterium]